ncbi:MAG: class I mannose-6-phosphate isomerase [Candidatus Auribacterota bacterium]|jgi:mannose-6-phosphate isomerase|nr:class I mannose-6-phosphate isomerase [Candidatus Auribacterota bacterium]
MTLYPIRFFSIFKEKVWGGSNLRDALGKDAPKGKLIGESWELVDRGDDVSVISNGEYKGKTLRDLFDICGRDCLLGSERSLDKFGRFPLLIKFLDAEERLSVQVHPDDVLAKNFDEADSGKSELWCVLHASPSARILYGCDRSLKNIDPHTRLTAEHEELFRYIPVKCGDIIYIPSGQVHALLEGCVVLEIQRNSDITYRLYDWDRAGDDGKPRELHLTKGLQAIGVPQIDEQPVNIFSDYTLASAPLYSNEFFKIYYNNSSAPYFDSCDGRTFKIIAVVEGEGSVCYGIDNAEISLRVGDIVLLPASMGGYTIRSDSVIHWLTVC